MVDPLQEMTSANRARCQQEAATILIVLSLWRLRVNIHVGCVSEEELQGIYG